ncbi:hypothetical protein AYI70_g2328 [Smittium culicis]|uniref:SAC domain-containing protein n=1 Tax=Smittium culicis TaxID=133412 RepID=A0A1R1X5I4_9FUNG|nr:hypothetical protein AYI70_g10659 [Smittium culicis]OMJ23330.1 hypothetical protein AYI70_g2328 [Smittium culicis]
MVNLVDKAKYEKPVGIAFERQVKNNNLPSIFYFHYDFHSESKKNKSAPIGNLVANSISQYLNTFGGLRFCVDSNSLLKLQTGVVRTNCMDCLDRTNVVQFGLAIFWINSELVHFNILSPGESIEDYAQIFYLLRNVWSDNADYISMAYAGTPALKTDLTRLSSLNIFFVQI